MSLIELPQVHMYCKTDTRIPQVADFMTRSKNYLIKSKLHFANNDEKRDDSPKDFKFSTLIDHFNSVCSTLSSEPHFSVDEQIIQYKGHKTSLRRYLPKKPKKK